MTSTTLYSLTEKNSIIKKPRDKNVTYERSKITSFMKVKTDIIAGIAPSLIGQVVVMCVVYR